MRWLFHDPNDRQEVEERSELLRQIDAWWAEFAGRSADLRATFKRQAQMDVPAWMQAHLQTVDPRLCWEYGPALCGDGHRLVITPESDRQLRPMVDTMLERAPRIDGWEFYPYRPPESVEMAHLTVEARVKLTIPDARVSVTRGDHHRVDVSFRSRSFADIPETQTDHAAFVAAETLLGEEALDRWVGLVEAERPGSEAPPARGGERRFLPLERLKPTFDAVVAATLEQLPPRPLHELDLMDSHPWTGYRCEALEQPEGSDYAARDDVFVGNTALVDVMQASRAPGFYPGRFSRFGEIFGYLKIDHAEVAQKQWVEFRSRFEDALEPALRGAKAGCIYGAATGIAYSYIDLAVTDIKRGVDIVRQALRRLDVPTRSWLLFFDPEYADEWVGLRGDTPPPPKDSEVADGE